MKKIICVLICALTLGVMAGPHGCPGPGGWHRPPPPPPGHWGGGCYWGGYNGVSLAADIVGLVGNSIYTWNAINTPRVIYTNPVYTTPVVYQTAPVVYAPAAPPPSFWW